MKNTILNKISYSFVAILAIFVMAFGVKASASEMVILAVTGKTDTTATVSAKVTNVLNDTNVRISFEYATNPSFVSSQITNEVSYSTSSASAFSGTITGLTPNTTYYVRALGLGNADGVAKPSSTLIFKTDSVVSPTTPTISILTASANGQNSFNASLHYDLGSSTTGNIWFEYGTSFGSYTNKTAPVSVATQSGKHNDTAVSLTAGTTYYVRAALQTGSNTYYSNSALMVTTDSINNTGNNPTVYVYGCMINSDPNYNPNANYHVDSMCANNYNNNGNWFNNWFGNWFGWGNNNQNNNGYTYNDPYQYNTYTNNYVNTNNAKDYCKYNNCDVVVNKNTKTNTSTSTKTSTSSSTSSKNNSLIVKGGTNKSQNTNSDYNYDANQQLASAFFGLGNGFLPTTLIGWLLLAFLMLLLIVLTRHYFYKKPKPAEVKKV